jgi:hypothetical protein
MPKIKYQDFNFRESSLALIRKANEIIASYLIRHACRAAHKEFGWEIFIAYSDAEAGEVGTVYQAVGWYYIGQPKQGRKSSFISPTGKRLSSYGLVDADKRLRRMGWDGQQTKSAFLRAQGWTEKIDPIKGKWLWFEGGQRRKRFMKSDCRFPFLPYPKRSEISKEV